MRSAGDRRETVTVVALIGAGVAAFATNQSIGVTLPVHVVGGLGGKAADVGLIAAAGTLGVIAGRVLITVMADRLRPTVLGAASMASIAVISLGYLLVQDSIVGLALVRALHGIAFAAATTALLVSMVTAVSLLSRQRSMALANLAMPVSAAIFPAVAIEVLDASLANVAAACVMCSVVGGIGYLVIPRASAPVPPVEISPPLASARGLRRLPALLLVTAALLGAADAAALDYLPVLATTRNIDGYGWTFTVLAVGSAATLALITANRRAVASTSLVVLGGVLTAGALASWPWIDSLVPLMVMMGTYGVGFAIAQTGVTALAAEWSPVETGKALAGLLLAFDLGRAVGVYLIGVLIDSFGFAAALLPLAGLLAVASVARGGRRERG